MTVKNTIKYITIIIILNLLFTNCITTKKYSNFVNTKTENLKFENDTLKDWLIIKSNKNEPKENIYTQIKFFFIPAIFYWEWNSTIECELNIDTRINLIKTSIYEAADSLNLKKYLLGNNLEIELRNIPGEFFYENKGNAITLIVSNMVHSTEIITPYSINLDFKYSVKNNESIIIKGDGFIKNKEQTIKSGLKSTKKFTWLYLENFQKEIREMGISLVSKIIKDIKTKEQN